MLRTPRAIDTATVLLDDQYDFTLNYVGPPRLGQAGFGRQYRGARLQALIPTRREDTRRGTIGRDRESLKSELPWRELSRVVKPDNRLRHIARSRKEVHYVRR